MGSCRIAQGAPLSAVMTQRSELERVGGRLKSQGTYIYLQLINAVIQQKLIQHCKATMCSVAQSWTVACQAPQSVEFARQEYWSKLPFPPLGDLPNPGTEPSSPVSPALAGGFFITVPPGKPKAITLQLKKKKDRPGQTMVYPAQNSGRFCERS